MIVGAEVEDHEFEVDNCKSPLLASQFIEDLGYRLTNVGVLNERIGLKILALEHDDDGAPANFAYASNMQCTTGMVLPYPVQHSIDWIDEMEGEH